MRYRENRRYEDPYKDYDWDYDGFPGEYVYGNLYDVDPDYGEEVWKPVRGFEGYWVSDYGRLYSTIRGRFIHGTPIGRSGHIDVSLRRDGKRYHRYLHRLVAEAFIENPSNLPIVRHMNDCPEDNEEWNLEWGTSYDNVHDCIKSNRFRYFTDEDIEKANAIRRTPIVAVNLKNGEEIEYISQQEASRDLGMTQGSINRVLRGLSKHAYGYYFYYANIPKKIDVSSYKYSRKQALIKAIDLITGEEFIFRGQAEAARELKMSISSISCILSGKIHQAKGYTFEYIEEEDYE